MLSKKELIENMVEAMLVSGQYHDFDIMAEAALQAMLSSLPIPVDGYQNKHDMYYRQLIAMRDK